MAIDRNGVERGAKRTGLTNFYATDEKRSSSKRRTRFSSFPKARFAPLHPIFIYRYTCIYVSFDSIRRVSKRRIGKLKIFPDRTPTMGGLMVIMGLGSASDRARLSDSLGVEQIVSDYIQSYSGSRNFRHICCGREPVESSFQIWINLYPRTECLLNYFGALITGPPTRGSFRSCEQLSFQERQNLWYSQKKN